LPNQRPIQPFSCEMIWHPEFEDLRGTDADAVATAGHAHAIN
jgi:hypothetical protein